MNGVGSRRWEEWKDAYESRSRGPLYNFQVDEFTRAFAESSAGGRPTTPWTPEMARQLIPEFFNANLDSRAAGAAETVQPTTDGAAPGSEKNPSTETKPTGDQAAAAPEPGNEEGAATPPAGAAPAAAPQDAAQNQAREQLPAKQAAYEEKRNVLKAVTNWTDSQERSEAQLDTLIKKDENCPSAASTSFTPPLGSGLKTESTAAWNEACVAWCELKTTEATANGQNTNAPASQSTSGSPPPAAVGTGGCRSGQGGGGGGGGGRADRPRPAPNPPSNSTTKDSQGIPGVRYEFFGVNDGNTNTRRRGYDFLVLHDGGYAQSASRTRWDQEHPISGSVQEGHRAVYQVTSKLTLLYFSWRKHLATHGRKVGRLARRRSERGKS